MRLLSFAVSMVVIATGMEAQTLTERVDREVPSLVSIYKDLHRAPELSTHEEKTSALVAKELRAGLVPGRAPLLWGLARCVNAARFAGKVILDGVYNDVKDPDGFAAECAQGAEMGFDGKTLIHPTRPSPPQPRRSSTRGA